MIKLKKIRQTRGLSQRMLAEKTKLNVRTLQHYEQGSKNFDSARLSTILKCALALQCRIEDLIENQDILNLIEQYKKSLQ